METMEFKVTVTGNELNRENVKRFIQGALETAIDEDGGNDASVLIGEPLGVQSAVTESL
jgi:hypothetical protein